MKETRLSRRAFLGLGATAAVAAGAAGLAGCAPQQSAGTASAEGDGSPNGGSASSKYTPDFLTPPPVPTDVKEEKDCDVLVIGMGIAGTAAAKEAAEAGKKVIVLEKQPEDSYSVISMAGDFGVVGSQIQKDLGIEWAPKEDIFNEFVKETGGRCDTWMMNYWYDHSGEDFDWFIEGADYEVLESTAANRKTDKPNFIRPKCFPPLETYNYKEEVYPYFHGTITTNPNMQWACEAAFNAAVAGGAELIYNAEGEQLIVENAKAVVLCCGDYGANPEMRHYYAPWTEEFMGGVDDGRGQLMGIWAGGWMELGPHAPMTHHMGGSLGVDSFLQLNMEGKRFMNEDVPGQNIAAEHTRQPVAKDPELAKAGVKAWQIFDSKWPEQIIHMPDGHGYTTYFVPDDQAAEYETVLSGFGLGYTTQAMVDERTDVIANSLEELAEKTGLPLETTMSCATRASTRTSARCQSACSRWRTRRTTRASSATRACWSCSAAWSATTSCASPRTARTIPSPACTWRATRWAAACWWITPSWWPASVWAARSPSAAWPARTPPRQCRQPLREAFPSSLPDASRRSALPFPGGRFCVCRKAGVSRGRVI